MSSSQEIARETMLLSGNEAVALGALHAGCVGGFGYPGTPSTETLEHFAQFEEVYAEWTPNEKVALEAALGHSLAGARTLVTMKHVGVNVAADPLMTLAYTGVSGGLVILVADDPGTHSSQNEQDSRNYAHFSKLPMFEPSDSQEAYVMTKAAFELSEQFETAVFIRSTTRISHTKSKVKAEVPTTEQYEKLRSQKQYEKNPAQWVMMPAMAKQRHPIVIERTKQIQQWAKDQEYNRIELSEKNRGFICSSAVYQHVKEAFPNDSVLKLGLSFPLEQTIIEEFFNLVEKVYIVEEADNYFDTHIRALGFNPEVAPLGLKPTGELTPQLVKNAFESPDVDLQTEQIEGLPGRPPALCPGCPHRLTFTELRRMKAVVVGDIGCYTLGAIAPLNAVDTTIDMGASISMAHGFDLAGGLEGRPTFAVIGDSTFTHSGMNSLLNTIYNNGAGNVVILDNRITAMTGAQGNPVNGITLQCDKYNELELVPFIKAMGINDVVEVNANKLTEVRSALNAARKNTSELSVVICKAPCALAYKVIDIQREVDQNRCTACGVCLRIGCPALSRNEDGKASIDINVCVGCSQCEQSCAFGAISARELEDLHV